MARATSLEKNFLSRSATLSVSVQPSELEGSKHLWTVSGGVDRNGLYRIGQGPDLETALSEWDRAGEQVAA